jgi:DMSO/TMAO reductase YedYZ molybdopterin-dependent catalytic subunit
MKKYTLGTGALVGGLLTAALMGIMYLGEGLFGLPFVPFDIFNWVARELPGDIVTFGIDLMIDSMRLVGISVVDAAKTAEQLMALVMFLVGGVVAGLLFFGFMRARTIRAGESAGLIMGLLYGFPQVIISLSITQSPVSPLMIILYLSFLYLAWGITLNRAQVRIARIEGSADEAIAALTTEATAVGAPEQETEQIALSEPAVVDISKKEIEIRSVEKLDRRQFLIRLGATTATITVLSGGLGAILTSAERRQYEETLAKNITAQAVSTPTLPPPDPADPLGFAGPFQPAPGTRPELTAIKDHYKVFLQTSPTYIDGDTWELPITGRVENPLLLTVEDFHSDRWESRDQYVTMSCISGRIGSGLIGTTQWTGVSVQDVLADAGLLEDARYLIITSGDGFHETVDLDLIASDSRIMFAYAWNGMDLPKDHGFPLRIWIPDRFGMKQPKWITGIEVVDDYQEGYWVKRNWDEDALVRTTSVIDTVAVDDIVEAGGQQLVPVGGIAWSGDRGISKVEVRVDGGPWEEARLKEPLSETTWVIWRYDWPFAKGNHTFEVQCSEVDGTRQITEKMGNRPSGATGIHSKDARL